MVVVSTIFVIAVVVVVVKVLARAAAVIDMAVVVEILLNDVGAGVVIGTLTGVEIIVVGAVVSALKFVVPIPYFVGTLSAVVAGASTDALACVIMGFVTGIDVEVLADANVNVFKSLITAFAVPEP